MKKTLGEWLGTTGPTKVTPVAGEKKAHFTAIEGTVKVKKSTSASFIDADYELPLEKGDVVQTGSEGMAKIVFADGTNYTVRQDSLIVVEENSTNAAQQTKVAVQVTTGTVDLSTATFAQGSKSQVRVAGATATFSNQTSAIVSNDPRADQSNILVKQGAGEVQRGNESVTLASFERVSFKMDSPSMTKVKELAPPTLITPANMVPLFSGKNASSAVDFSWTPVQNAAAYRIRVSRNPYFSSTVLDTKVRSESYKIPSLGEGAYYWMVTSFDAKGKESIESEKNRFNIVEQRVGATLALELEPFVQHGRVIEVRGKTEPNARVMVNGEEVPIVNSDGRFNYFTPPLPSGENNITVTAQNARGGHNTQVKKVVI